MQPKGQKPGAKDSREKMTPEERAKAVPPGTSVDTKEYMRVLRRLASTPAKGRAGPPRKRSGSGK